MIRVLITGAGGTAGRNFCRCIRNFNHYFIIGVDVNKYHLSCNPFLDAKEIVPEANHCGYISAIQSIIKRHQIDVIHAQPDMEVRILGSYRDDLGARTMLPPQRTIITCQDKWQTYLSIISIDTTAAPMTSKVSAHQVIEHSIYSWVRCRFGAGAKAALPVWNGRQMDGWLDYWRKRGIPPEHFIASEFLPGREYAFQSLWNNGILVASAARERLEYAGGAQSPSGQTSSPSIAVSVHNAKINRVATTAINSVTDNCPHGVFCVDLKEDSVGDPKVTEINAGRFFTTSDFFANIGCNMPNMYLRLALGENVKPIGYDAVPSDMYWIRGMDRVPILMDKDGNHIIYGVGE